MDAIWITFIVVGLVLALLIGTNVYLLFVKEDRVAAPDVSDTKIVYLDVEFNYLKAQGKDGFVGKDSITVNDLVDVLEPGYVTADGTVLAANQLVMVNQINGDPRLVHLGTKGKKLSTEMEIATHLAFAEWVPGTVAFDNEDLTAEEQMYLKIDTITQGYRLSPPNANVQVHFFYTQYKGYTGGILMRYPTLTQAQLDARDYNMNVWLNYPTYSTTGTIGDLFDVMGLYKNGAEFLRVLKPSSPSVLNLTTVNYTVTGYIEESFEGVEYSSNSGTTRTGTSNNDEFQLTGSMTNPVALENVTLTPSDNHIVVNKTVNDLVPSGIPSDFRCGHLYVFNTPRESVSGAVIQNTEAMVIGERLTMYTNGDHKVFFTPTSVSYTVEPAWVLYEDHRT